MIDIKYKIKAFSFFCFYFENCISLFATLMNTITLCVYILLAKKEEFYAFNEFRESNDLDCVETRYDYSKYITLFVFFIRHSNNDSPCADVRVMGFKIKIALSVWMVGRIYVCLAPENME